MYVRVVMFIDFAKIILYKKHDLHYVEATKQDILFHQRLKYISLLFKSFFHTGDFLTACINSFIGACRWTVLSIYTLYNTMFFLPSRINKNKKLRRKVLCIWSEKEKAKDVIGSLDVQAKKMSSGICPP